MTFFYILKREAAKKMTCPINKLKIFCSFGQEDKLASNPSLHTTGFKGLRLQGAAFAKNILCKVNKCDSELLLMPSLSVSVQSSDEDLSKNDTNSCYYAAPLFSEISRQEILAELNLPCLPDDKNKWALAAIALFIN